jgi:hypothetical protein
MAPPRELTDGPEIGRSAAGVFSLPDPIWIVHFKSDG